MPYSQPAFAPPAYGQPAYGPQPYGPPAYGPPSYGQSGYVPAPYGQPGMLAAAADRERTIDVLKAAYGEGRLSKDEFDLRCGRVMSARTYGDLSAVVADLPSGPVGVMAPYQGHLYQPVRVPPTNGMAIASLVCGLAFGIGAVPAVILGHLAYGQIRRNGERGEGLAIAGLVLGYLGIGLWMFIIIVTASLSGGPGS